jgi:hypothetical protein
VTAAPRAPQLKKSHSTVRDLWHIACVRSRAMARRPAIRMASRRNPRRPLLPLVVAAVLCVAVSAPIHAWVLDRENGRQLAKADVMSPAVSVNCAALSAKRRLPIDAHRAQVSVAKFIAHIWK